MNIYAIIVAGGTGTRMGNKEKPKQYLPVGGKPIIVHTMEKFCSDERFRQVIVLCPGDWVAYTRELLREYLPENRYAVVAGGRLRNDTIMNGIRYIQEHDGLEENTYLVTHDAVRPFVTPRILEENIAFAATGQPCTTCFPTTDTLLVSTDGATVAEIPDRTAYYQVQTPQSFRAEAFRELYGSLSDEEREALTDAARVFVVKGQRVALVMGEKSNIKLTYPSDLKLAEGLLGHKEEI